MASRHRPKECETFRYRHGCDPPKRIQPSSEPHNQPPDLSSCEAIPHSINRVPAIPVGFSFSISFTGKKVRNAMPAATLTTTLSELNRLFGLYHEVADQKTPSSEEAQKAWIAYETYARRYNKERGL